MLALAASKLGEWFAQALRGSEARLVGVCFFWWEVRPLGTWPFWQRCLSLVAYIYRLTWAAWVFLAFLGTLAQGRLAVGSRCPEGWDGKASERIVEALRAGTGW